MAGRGGCCCTPASAAQPSARAAGRQRPPAAHGTDAHDIVPARRRDALRAWRRGAASAAGAGSQMHLLRRAQRTSAAGNARRTPRTHGAARRRCGRHMARRAAACAWLQSRVLHRAEAVRAPQTAADGGLEHHARCMCDEEQLRDDAAASGRFLMQSGSNVRAESATAAPRAADASAARRYRPECGATRAPCSTLNGPVRQQCWVLLSDAGRGAAKASCANCGCVFDQTADRERNRARVLQNFAEKPRSYSYTPSPWCHDSSVRLPPPLHGPQRGACARVVPGARRGFAERALRGHEQQRC